MLIINRRQGESFVIGVKEDANKTAAAAGTPLQEQMVVTLIRCQGGQAKIGIDAPPRFTIMRSELL